MQHNSFLALFYYKATIGTTPAPTVCYLALSIQYFYFWTILPDNIIQMLSSAAQWSVSALQTFINKSQLYVLLPQSSLLCVSGSSSAVSVKKQEDLRCRWGMLVDTRLSQPRRPCGSSEFLVKNNLIEEPLLPSASGRPHTTASPTSEQRTRSCLGFGERTEDIELSLSDANQCTQCFWTIVTHFWNLKLWININGIIQILGLSTCCTSAWNMCLFSPNAKVENAQSSSRAKNIKATSCLSLSGLFSSRCSDRKGLLSLKTLSKAVNLLQNGNLSETNIRNFGSKIIRSCFQTEIKRLLKVP